MSRVALIGENSIGYVNALLDIWNHGDCAVLIDWRIPFETAVDMMKEADVKKCYIETGVYPEISDEEHSSVLLERYEKLNLKAEELPSSIYDKFRENYSKEEAVVIYSSGTTGKSKGIILSHFAINMNADAIIDYMKPTSDDCIYICKTLSHSSTLVGELLVALKTKTKLIVAPVIVPPRYVLNNLEKYGVTILCVNPTLLSLYADSYIPSKFNLSVLRTIYVSGSILNDNVYTKAHETFSGTSIYNVYGLSEAGPRVTAQTENSSKSNSVGKPIKGVQIQIVDEQGKPLPRGDRGILHVSTQSQFNGYVVGSQKHLSLYKTWLNTGDIGYIDNDGELHIVGRVDDVIIIDSHKIYPSTIEGIIMESRLVKECVVFKIEKNKKTYMGCLYVGMKDETITLRNYLKKVLMPYEIPDIIQRSSFIPKTVTGKITRQKVMELISLK